VLQDDAFSPQKRVSITFPADGCVRNFFGFGDKEWRHSLPLSSFPVGGLRTLKKSTSSGLEL
jgi:hypothetical protein